MKKKFQKQMKEYVNNKITEYIKDKQSKNEMIDIAELRVLKSQWVLEFEEQMLVTV